MGLTFRLHRNRKVSAVLQLCLDFRLPDTVLDVGLPPRVPRGTYPRLGETKPFVFKLLPGPGASLDARDIALEVRDRVSGDLVTVAGFEDYAHPPPATGHKNRGLGQTEQWEAFAKFCQLGARIQRAEQEAKEETGW